MSSMAEDTSIVKALEVTGKVWGRGTKVSLGAVVGRIFYSHFLHTGENKL